MDFSVNIDASLQECLYNPEKTKMLNKWTEFYPTIPGNLLDSIEPDTNNPLMYWGTIPVRQQMVDIIRLTGFRVFGLIRSQLNEIKKQEKEKDGSIWNAYNFPRRFRELFLNDRVMLGEMRLDLIVNPKAYYESIVHNKPVCINDIWIIEWNTETPGFYAETYSLQALVNDYFSTTCPNFKDGLDWGMIHGKGNCDYYSAVCKASGLDPKSTQLTFTYPGTELTNYVQVENVDFAERMAQFQHFGYDVQFLYFQDLIIDAFQAVKGVYDGQIFEESKLQKISVLYSHFPTEFLMIEEFTSMVGEFCPDLFEGYEMTSVWEIFQNMILKGDVIRLPGSVSFVAQNKGFYAMIYDHYLNNQLNESDSKVVKDHFLPTFLTSEDAQEQESWYNQKIVKKPVNGRKGAGISIFNVDSLGNIESIIDTNESHTPVINDWYQSQDTILQHYRELPKIQLNDATLSIMFTVYVSPTGQGCGVAARAYSLETVDVINEKNDIWVPLSVLND